ncbi:MAG: hypothetical protein M3Y44_13195 [Actinomycetota bacterium]|nr:hypothetical protein [Actinomycetota bacterium]
MSWIALIAWIGALVIAAVVLGFCAFEIVWKARRLLRDAGELQADAVALAQLQEHLAAAKQRLARAGDR